MPYRPPVLPSTWPWQKVPFPCVNRIPSAKCEDAQEGDPTPSRGRHSAVGALRPQKAVTAGRGGGSPPGSHGPGPLPFDSYLSSLLSPVCLGAVGGK